MANAYIASPQDRRSQVQGQSRLVVRQTLHNVYRELGEATTNYQTTGGFLLPWVRFFSPSRVPECTEYIKNMQTNIYTKSNLLKRCNV